MSGSSEEGRPLLRSYAYLTIAILSEVIGTSALKASDGFSRLVPSLVTVAAYAIAFYFLAQTLKVIPVGVAYAIWSGVGIVLIALIGFFWFGQSLDAPAVIGLGLIIAGVVVVNGFSGSVSH
jgi:small multidrug resistance pump